MVRFHTFFCLPHCFFLLGSPGFLQRIRLNRRIEKEILLFLFFKELQFSTVTNKGVPPVQANNSSLQMTARFCALKLRPVGSTNMLTENVYFHQGLAAGAKSSRRNMKNSHNIDKIRNSLTDPVDNLMIQGQDTPLAGT